MPLTEDAYAAFEQEVRAFALANCPEDIRRVVRNSEKLTRDVWARWQRILSDHGWGAPNWPVSEGGTGWDARQRYIFDTTLAECECPPQYHHGLRHLGPVLIAYGTEEQKKRFLPGILSGDDWWCQGFSEPGSGSDLASLRTKAVLDGDAYVVNGQKIWTSHAQEADWMYTLVRTSNEGKKQAGITFVLIDIRSPGVTVKKIETIDGIHHVNEVFLDNVRVPVENRIGEEDKGWALAKYLLSHERLGGANTAPLFQMFQNLRDLVDRDTGGALRRSDARRRLVTAETRLRGLKEQGRIAVATVMQGGDLGIMPSALKIVSTEIAQELSELAMEIAARDHAGDLADPAAAHWSSTYYYNRSRTIVGGTNEVQRNLIAQAMFAGGVDAVHPPAFGGEINEAAQRIAAGTPDWAQVAEMGWPMTLVPEADGGVGATLSDLAAAIEGAGRGGLAMALPVHCGVTPVLLTAGQGARRDAALEGHLSGGAPVLSVLALSHRLEVSAEGGGVRLRGPVRGIAPLPGARELLVATEDRLVLVPLEGLTPVQGVGIDGRATVGFDLDLAVPPEAVLLSGDGARLARDRAQALGAMLTCVESIGLMASVLKHVLAYLGERRQFGQTLSEFQVLRHRAADMLIDLMNASALVVHAVQAQEQDDAGALRVAALAKIGVSRAARRSAEAAIQLHGGMGMTEELAVTPLNKRLIQAGFDFGDALHHEERLDMMNA
ncbi:acyl-CoA dehydrogenase family protein [Oceanicola sp. 22II-s10i]|uniref:acyl-CoA dehydrogenase family protein n=1 Tax=Oceanicola sp. 22II-s10i TaxID=1317116 RepID=UPI0011320FD1|nr:acyl-CoA dehydrogenase family protein [Oceanicola sp. 22II-s10i]